jgi:putative transposase
VIRDFDGKFGADFDATLKAQGIKVMRVCPRRPKMNAHAERWILSARTECLHHFVVFGERHLRYLLNEYLAHYNGALGGDGLIKASVTCRWHRSYHRPRRREPRPPKTCSVASVWADC